MKKVSEYTCEVINLKTLNVSVSQLRCCMVCALCWWPSFRLSPSTSPRTRIWRRRSELSGPFSSKRTTVWRASKKGFNVVLVDEKMKLSTWKIILFHLKSLNTKVNSYLQQNETYRSISAVSKVHNGISLKPGLQNLHKHILGNWNNHPKYNISAHTDIQYWLFRDNGFQPVGHKNACVSCKDKVNILYFIKLSVWKITSVQSRNKQLFQELYVVQKQLCTNTFL
jgi:hypothetical protein